MARITKHRRYFLLQLDWVLGRAEALAGLHPARAPGEDYRPVHGPLAREYHHVTNLTGKLRRLQARLRELHKDFNNVEHGDGGLDPISRAS
ncbi:hypothetical protein HMPREF1624_05787 [Sporothrix schenckii ATCC 58251]|uniref:Uncharacterized protein n=1 Tax=Sporothrix schenckii (strain ATCC 58251 / de Perez 2211183) TaxID=1391915 RepID=U7PRP8_SPOS1|nr:hypothetical protein HMPREF1624_05787 [Sporothrix schenckii ATCC 58251]